MKLFSVMGYGMKKKELPHAWLNIWHHARALNTVEKFLGPGYFVRFKLNDDYTIRLSCCRYEEW
jgi:hypothetical protein